MSRELQNTHNTATLLNAFKTSEMDLEYLKVENASANKTLKFQFS